MLQHPDVVLKIVAGQLSVTQAGEQCLSRQYRHKLLARYRAGGLDALQPQSRRPHSNSAVTSPNVRDRIIWWRPHLAGQGLDAGEVLATNTINPDTNYWPNTMKQPGRWPG